MMRSRALSSLPLLILAALALAEPAHSAILFLNLNNSVKEIQKAREAAKLRGEELIIYPEIDDPIVTRELQKLDDNNRALQFQLEGTVNKQYRPLAAKISRLEKDPEKNKVALEKERTKIMALLEKLAADLAKQDEAKKKLDAKAKPYLFDLATLKSKMAGQTYSTVIISGHSLGLQTEGALGELKYKDIYPFLKESPELRDLQSVYLWGCYTMTTETARIWSENMPSLKFVAGFEQKSPLDANPSSHNLLKDLLLKEARIAKEEDAAKIAYVLRNLAAVPKSFAAKVYGCYYTGAQPGRGLQSLEVANGDCTSVMQTFKAVTTAKFESYYFAKKENFEDPPPSSDHANPLRDVYSLFKRIADCFSAGICSKPNPPVECSTPEKFQSYPDFHKVAGMLFFRQMKRGFALYYKNDIERMKSKLIEHCGKESEHSLPFFSNASRKELISFGSMIEPPGSPFTKALSPWIVEADVAETPVAKCIKNLNETKHEDAAIFADFHQKMARVLLQLDCAPVEWGGGEQQLENFIRDGRNLPQQQPKPECAKLSPAI